MSIISDRLKLLRTTNKYNQIDVARGIGISKSAYSRFEIGERDPLTSHILLLANFYHCSADYILGLSDDPASTIGETQSISYNDSILLKKFNQLSDINKVKIIERIDTLLSEQEIENNQAKKIG